MGKSGNQFLSLPGMRRSMFLDQAAAVRGVHPAVVEKDFWVCWLLDIVFSDDRLAPHFALKGGQCLVKVHRAIDRFSDEVELGVSPRYVREGLSALLPFLGGKLRSASSANTADPCASKAERVVVPALEEAIRRRLGTPGAGASWLRFRLDGQTPVVHFQYPASCPSELAVLSRDVRLKLETLAEDRRMEACAVRAWIAEDYPQLFSEPEVRVAALDLPTMFWQKAALLHAEHFRPKDRSIPPRLSAHYSDVARLATRDDASTFLKDRELAARVAASRAAVLPPFAPPDAPPRHGTFRLVPAAERLTELAADHAAMRPLFLGDPLPFDEVLAKLADAEHLLNAAGG